MKRIDTKFHGFLDYGMALLLIASPYFFGLDGDGPENITLYAFGAATLVYSMLTDYDLGLVKIIPMKLHLAIDILSGIALTMSPWLFGFADQTILPHVGLGIIEILAATVTDPYRNETTRLI